MAVDPLDGDADLPGVGEGAEGGLLGGPGRVDALVDDERVVAAVLQHGLRAGPRAARAIARPVAELPTCATTSTSAAARRAPTSPSPSRISSTPSGRCAASSSANRRPVCGQRSLGLWTTVLPVTSAAPSRPAATATGSFQGVRTATTPRGPGTMKSAASQRPCRLRPRCTGPSSAYWTQRADAGVDPAARVGERLAGLALVERGELVGGVADGRGGGVQRGGALGGGGAGPAVGRGAGPCRAESHCCGVAIGTRPTVSPVRGSSTVISRVRTSVTPAATRSARCYACRRPVVVGGRRSVEPGDRYRSICASAVYTDTDAGWAAPNHRWRRQHGL